MFRATLIKETATLGFALRFFGIDLAALVTGETTEWRGVYLYAFGQGMLGVCLQVLFLTLFLGRNDGLYAEIVREGTREEGEER